MPLAYGLIHPVELPLPQLPPAQDGLRVAHLTDFHVRRPAAWHDRLLNQLTSHRFDLIFLTGDYIDRPGQEPAALELLRRLLDRLHPRLGTFGVFGNHDTAELREQCQPLPVTWLHNTAHRLPGIPIEILGLDMLFTEEPDAAELAINWPAATNDDPDRPVRLLLAHAPSTLTTAADCGVDAMFCGHTHGGQCRLPTGHALINASDLPLDLSSGLLRHQNTLIGISRGLGYTGWIPRLFCRPHVPVYTLRRRSMPGQFTEQIQLLERW